MRQSRGLTKDGKWVYGWYCEIAETHFIIPKSAMRTIYRGINPSSNRLDFTGFIEVLPETVGQSTGLRDKNSKEIYEGDIYKEGKRMWTVVFASGSFMGDWANGSIQRFINHEDIEIIGNVHQDKELLEK